MITKCFFKHLVCFRCRLAEFEAEFDANPLLLQISHFGRSERSQNSTNTTLKKCTEKEHSSTQHNATWQTGSQRVQLAIPRGPQPYYKRFSRGIQISGTFGLHHVYIYIYIYIYICTLIFPKVYRLIYSYRVSLLELSRT
jgi:hypothetical protein